MKARQTESIGRASRLTRAGMLFALAAVLTPLVVRAEKANVFFIHGANVSENDARAWAAVQMARRSGQSHHAGTRLKDADDMGGRACGQGGIQLRHPPRQEA